MKAKNVLFIFIVASLFLATVANSTFAQNATTSTSRVTVGQNYQGDALLGPLYNALGDYTTKLTVINTSETDAIVAKIVFRSPALSAETLDFLLYLTPSDVWDATITLDDSGLYGMITSTDDSCLAKTDVWASEDNPMQEVFQTDKLAGDINTFGHFEILGAAALPLTAIQIPYSKATLYNQYHYSFAIAGFVDVPNVLTGKITMNNSKYGQKVELNMTALANWESTPLVGWTPSTYNHLAQSIFNSPAEIDACLAKTEFNIPYDLSESGDANVLILTTFPTKYFNTEVPFATPYFPNIPIVLNTYKVWDMQEKKYDAIISGQQSVLSSEVNFVDLAALIPDPLQEGFTKGWLKTTYYAGVTAGVSADGTAITYAGVPMLNSYVTISQQDDMNWVEAAAPESAVTYGGTAVRQ